MAKQPDGDKVSALRRMREDRHAGRGRKALEKQAIERVREEIRKKCNKTSKNEIPDKDITK